MDYRLVHKMNLSRGNAIAGVCDAGRVMSRSETTSNNSPYNPQMGARSPASLVISSVWKPYMKHNCKLDDLGAGFEIAAGYWIWHGGYLIFKPRLSSKVYSDKTHYEGGSYTFSEV